MEQYSKYLRLMKSKHILSVRLQANNAVNPFSNESWEEQAFAEDAAGLQIGGGFTWPPRSYSCSFCKREFRSAQALGGHMNVHRRDRARLKQSLSTPQSDQVQPPLHHDQYPNPNSTCLSSTHDHHPFSSNFHLIRGPDSKPGFGFEKNNGRVEYFLNPGHHDDASCVDLTNLSMGLNLVVSQNQPSGRIEGDEVMITCKRQKSATTKVSPMPFVLNQYCSSERFPFKAEVIGHKTGSLEDLDLELRLGDPTKVK